MREVIISCYSTTIVLSSRYNLSLRKKRFKLPRTITFKKIFLKLADSMKARIDINFIVDYLLVLTRSWWIQSCCRFLEKSFSTNELNCYFLKNDKGIEYGEQKNTVNVSFSNVLLNWYKSKIGKRFISNLKPNFKYRIYL